MLRAAYSSRFKKDLKRMQKGGADKEKFKQVAIKLINQEKLPEKYKDHGLIGNYKGRRECHIEPDWLLIYKTTDDKIIFERTGAHADLFG